MTLQMEKFRENLEDFAAKHKNEIKKNPQFRKQFQEMCASIGVDPLASGKGEYKPYLNLRLRRMIQMFMDIACCVGFIYIKC